MASQGGAFAHRLAWLGTCGCPPSRSGSVVLGGACWTPFGLPQHNTACMFTHRFGLELLGLTGLTHAIYGGFRVSYPAELAATICLPVCTPHGASKVVQEPTGPPPLAHRSAHA